MIFKPQSNRSGLHVNNVTLRSNRSLTPQPEPQPELQPDHSSLFITNGDVMQTAAARTAVVCLGQNRVPYCKTGVFNYIHKVSLAIIDYGSHAMWSTQCDLEVSENFTLAPFDL